MKNIITIQHTQSLHHTNGMVGSIAEWDLTEYGREQAKIIGHNLYEELASKDYKFYSSSSLRAKHTAQIIAELFNAKITFRDELRERDLGKAVGKTKSWFKENMECQEVTIDDRMFSDAESKREKWNSLLPFYNEIMKSEDENIIIVAHGESLGIFNGIWLGLKVESLNKCGFWGKPGGVSFLNEENNGKHFIHKMSDLSYRVR